MRLFIYALMVLLCSVAAVAQVGHMRLLAVSEQGEQMVGSIADLTLEIKPGTGNIFIATSPLTKLDTQISTRFANEIACKELQVDCSRFDFFYTISSSSAIVGGPSAGGAIAVLTAAMLAKATINQSISMTGTINAGGLIGPVGGIKEKIEVAGQNGISAVLIPKGERRVNATNRTVDLVEYGEAIGVHVIEVSRLDQALEAFTGKPFIKAPKALNIAPMYAEVMRSLAYDLCNRTEDIKGKITVVTNLTNYSYQLGLNLSEKGNAEIDNQSYYSAASFCFGANVRFRYAMINATSAELQRLMEITQRAIAMKERDVKAKGYSTVTDLQAYLAVNERITEAFDHLEDARKAIDINNTDNAAFSLAFAMERLYSASSWGAFFGKGGRSFILDKDIVTASCATKLREAEERYQYVLLFLPQSLEDTKRDLSRARADASSGDVELCLYRASKAKAEADLVLTMLGLDQSQVDSLLAERLELSRQSIAEQQDNGVFPILGYSYYEYAKSLRGSDPYSAFLYSGYALEMSNLDLYISPKRRQVFLPADDQVPFFSGVAFGIAAGILIALTLVWLTRKKGRAQGKKR
ncbi:MAG: S16 family serine protease [Nanoarchaeota archaeon]